MLKSLLTYHLARGLNIDDPRTTALRNQIIAEKPFLKKIYKEWHNAVADCVPLGDGPVLEIGAGAGDMTSYIDDLVKSEIFPCPNIDIVLNGCKLPFADEFFRGIVLVNVLHHIPDCRAFFMEAERCVQPNGVLVMIEPWVSSWSRRIYSRHHEPFDPDATTWEFPSTGPLSGTNQALPWIVFERDRDRFEKEYPSWRIEKVELGMPFRYLISGGMTWRSLMPNWTFTAWKNFELLLNPVMDKLAMFALIKLTRTER
jgi:SAM-dependent methyltransferase